VRPRGAAAVLLLVTAFAAAALASGSSAPSRRALRVLYGRYLSFAPLAIADAEGRFREQGLDVELVHLTGANDMTPALFRGEIDVGAGMLKPAEFNAIARGATLRIVADKGHFEAGPCVSAALVVRPGFIAVSDAGSPRHLRDARVSAAPLSFAEYVLDTFLAPKGLSLDDVRRVRLPEASAAAALADGSVDIQHMSEPFLTRAVRSGRAVVWKPVVEILPGAQLATIVYGPTLLEKDRGAGVRFLAAYLQGVRQYNRGKTPRNVEIISKETGLDADLVREACWESIREDGRINVESVLQYQRWAVRRGLLDALVPPERFWDPTFLDEANRLLGPPAP
jgi:NitT/TauT family transport system substrate-binding protein